MQGMERADILPNLVATVTDIEGMDYRSIASVPSEDDKSLKLVGEGAKIPQTEVKTRENLVKLHKRGRMLVASYEALRFQRLDLFTVTLNQIGAYIARAQLKDAIDVLVNGDGNENPAGTLNVATGGKVTYEDLLKLWTELAPYELNTILASTPEMQKILSLSQLQDSNAGLDFQATGRMITPLGASLLHTPELEGGCFRDQICKAGCVFNGRCGQCQRVTGSADSHYNVGKILRDQNCNVIQHKCSNHLIDMKYQLHHCRNQRKQHSRCTCCKQTSCHMKGLWQMNIKSKQRRSIRSKVKLSFNSKIHDT